MKMMVPAIALVLAGCAASLPPHTVNPLAQDRAAARIVPVSQPRRLSEAEARISGPAAEAAAARMAGHDRAMFQIEAALATVVPDHAVTDMLLTDETSTGWRCGRVGFAGSSGGLVRFAARLNPEPVEIILGREPAAFDRVRALCG